jgi:hypothetical protein
MSTDRLEAFSDGVIAIINDNGLGIKTSRRL